jgi:hypothetical protein
MSTLFAGANLIPNLIALLLTSIGLFVTIRAFYIFANVQNPRIFILGVSMGVISLTAIADFISSNFTNIQLNTDWFLYLGQAISLLFIFLSLIKNDSGYFRRLMSLHILVSALLLGLLLLSPTLPPFPNTLVRAILSGSRSILCLSIFYFYISAFLKKQTRFSLLMGIAFALLGFGYLVIVQQYFVPNGASLDNVGDIIRMTGLITLLVAVLRG